MGCESAKVHAVQAPLQARRIMSQLSGNVSESGGRRIARVSDTDIWFRNNPAAYLRRPGDQTGTRRQDTASCCPAVHCILSRGELGMCQNVDTSDLVSLAIVTYVTEGRVLLYMLLEANTGHWFTGSNRMVRSWVASHGRGKMFIPCLLSSWMMFVAGVLFLCLRYFSP